MMRVSGTVPIYLGAVGEPNSEPPSVMAHVSPRRHRSGRAGAAQRPRRGRHPWHPDARRAESTVRKDVCHARPPPRLLAPQALAE
eukprot:2678181-Prymnesium_polylepis.1